MNKISKVDMIDYLSDKLNIDEAEIDNIKKIVDEFYNLKNDLIMPLSEEETFCFRKRYGIIDNGIPQPLEKISKECNIQYMKLKRTLENVIVKLGFRVKKLDNYKKVEKLSSIDLDSRVEYLKKMSITLLPINTLYKNRLIHSYILNIKDLMELGRPEIKEILSSRGLNEVTKYIHALDISFIDELPVEKRKEIMDNSSSDIMLASSIYWINGTEKIPNDYYEQINIKDIKTLIVNMNFLPIKKQSLIINGLKEMNLKVFDNKKSIK